VQVIDDWNSCRKLGLVIEARVGEGQLLVCTMDIDTDLPERPAARQLRQSLLAYVSSERFRPSTRLDISQLRTLFRDLTPAEKLGVRIRRTDSHHEGFAGSLAIDDDPQTMWHTAWGDNAAGFPHELILELGSPAELAGLTMLPRQDGNRNGWIKGYEVLVSAEGTNWGTPIAQGEFPATESLKTVRFPAPVKVRFLKLRALSGHAHGPWASLAELGLLLPESR
jgi:hypothetical protein